MSMEHKKLICGFCQFEWTGLWDMGSSRQTPEVLFCPRCRREQARLRLSGLFIENAFEVRNVDGDVVCILPGSKWLPEQGATTGERAMVHVRLPKDYALNVAAWIAKCADADEDFRELYERIMER